MTITMETKKKVTVSFLKCEYLKNPIGIDEKAPRLSWQIKSSKRGTMQTAYQVTIATTPEDLITQTNLLWDTGKVISATSSCCEYSGPPVVSRQRYYWKVRIWDEQAGVTPWSEEAFWEMGLLEKTDWQAKWVEPIQTPVKREAVDPEMLFVNTIDEPRSYEDFNPCLMIRKSFFVKPGIKQARVYATAHGIYSLELNGSYAGNQELAPEITTYHKYLMYQIYDVTNRLIPGENIIGVTLADGWYTGRIGGPGLPCNYGDKLALLLQLEIEYEDGSIQVIASDKSFKSSIGPLVYSDLFVGERYDARREKNGWSNSSYDDSGWVHVTIADYDYDNLVAQYGEPVQAIEEIKPLGVIRTPKGETVVDLGQNIAGRIRMRVTGPTGTEVTLEHSEVLDEHGNFLINILGKNKDQKDVYVLKGGQEEIFEPKFTFHGFRYVKVSGYPGEVSVDNFTGVVLASALQSSGFFECSDPRLNQLQSNIVWSQKGNMLSIPTDCPQRERAGWTGDIQIYAPTACFNMDVAAFLTRWMRNVVVEQLPDGQIPTVVPYFKCYEDVSSFLFDGAHSSAGWGDACIIVPWVLYNLYGDMRILKETYETMTKWVVYIEKCANEGLSTNFASEASPERLERQRYLWNTGFHFGDWLIPSLVGDNTPEGMMNCAVVTRELVSTCFYAYSTELMAEISKLLGRTVEANRYAELNNKIRKAFSEEYLNNDGRLSAHFQGIYVLALNMKMIPDEMKAKVVKQLVGLIEENGFKLDTGFVSVPYLLDVLCDNGRKDIAYRLLYQKNCPSWLYEIEKGATTIWESWTAITPEGKVTPASFNHYAFGCVGDWMYRYIAGIRVGAPGYKHIVIQPDTDKTLTYAKASYQSIYGEIASSWSIEAGMVRLKVNIPPNASATVKLHAVQPSEVIESKTLVEKCPYIQVGKTMLGENCCLEIGSGEYCFEYPYK
ncbi:MAG: alpha-L-rhamnosidase [Firmicutes bacterium]|nr:alpha-L-rhamnosidase [Bacillota bacterium]